MSLRKRIISLDTLRGYFLFAIIVDHLGRFPSPFQLLTGGGLLWVSAAEGFFIISGFLIGYLNQSASKLIKRASKLYLLTISLTILFTVWAKYLPSYAVKWGVWQGSLREFIFSTLSLKYTYGWADFLPFYVVFLLFSPIALFIQKKLGPLALISISILLWFVKGTNTYLAWQIYFMTGLAFGGKYQKLKDKIDNLPYKKTLIICLSILALSAVFKFVLNINLSIFDKDTVGPARIPLAWVWFLSLFLFFKKNQSKIEEITNGFLRVLGQNSLLVYTLHSIILFPINSILPNDYSNIFTNTLANTIVLLTIFIATKALRR